MSLFGRKEKRIIERLLKTAAEQKTECSDKVAELEKECEALHRELSEAKAESHEAELIESERKCAEYKIELDKANSQINELKRSLFESENQIKELKSKNDAIQKIENIVKKNHASDVYCSIDDLFDLSGFFKDKSEASYEYKMYRHIVKTISEIKTSSKSSLKIEGQPVKLSLFAKVRLADIVNLQYPSYSEFRNANSKNADLCNYIKKNIKPDFDNEDYKKAVLYRLFRLHVDFLICLNENKRCVPLLVIELHGDNHDENSKNADKDTIINDKFKRALFESENVKIDFMIVENKELAEADKLKEKLRAKLVECLEKRDNAISVKQ